MSSIAAGHNMLGLSMATATGKLVAELLGGGSAAHRSRAVFAGTLWKVGDSLRESLRGQGGRTAPRLGMRGSLAERVTYFFSTTSTNPTSMYCPPPVWWQWTAITFFPP